MSDDIKINDQITIPGYELWRTTSTAGGPGGQHVNRTETKVTLHWVPHKTGAIDGADKRRLVHRLRKRLTKSGELQVSSQETRSQKRNEEQAAERLANIVRSALKKRKSRKRRGRSKAADRRRLADKRHRGQIKELRQSPKPRDH